MELKKYIYAKASFAEGTREGIGSIGQFSAYKTWGWLELSDLESGNMTPGLGRLELWPLVLTPQQEWVSYHKVLWIVGQKL